MALLEGQVQVRDLVMGPGTPYTLFRFNPFQRRVRADQGGPRAWNHGAWSGAEWAEEKIIPLRLIVSDEAVDMVSWVELDQQLAAAFAPVGDVAIDIEMRFALGGREYLVLGRPRMVDPDIEQVGSGWSLTQCAFVAPDPRIFDAVEGVEAFGLPEFTGGLTVPFTVPFTVDGVLVDGFADLVNEGTTETSLLIRIDGPVSQPRVALLRPDGQVQTLRVLFDLAAGQWLTIDTGAHTVLLQDTANRRAQVAGQFPVLPPGTSRLRFFAAQFSEEAQVSATWRSAWW